MKKRGLFWFLILIAAIIPAQSNAEIVWLPMVITSGEALTGGGFDGMGVGPLLIEGSFFLTIDVATGTADIEDFGITFVHPLTRQQHLSTFDWNSLEGTFNLGNLSLSSPAFMGLTNELSGTFNGQTALLQGIVYDGTMDGYSYDCLIEAVIFPEPTTLSLLALGAMAAGRKTRRV